MKGWNEKSAEDLKRERRIRGWKSNGPKHPTPNGRIVAKHFKRQDKTKDQFTWSLWKWANDKALQLIEEYKFHPERKWRFDFCFPAIMVACEYEGVFSDQSRHTNKIGYSKDTDKYRSAAKMGWKVLRYTAANADQVINDLNEVYDYRK